MAEQLKRDDKEIRKTADNDVTESLKRMASIGPGNGDFDRAQDKSVLLMLGGVAANKNLFSKVIRELAVKASDIAGAQGIVHLFVAQGFSKQIQGKEVKQPFADELIQIFHGLPSEQKDRFSLHLLGNVSAKDVGALMNNGLTITKSGGGTMAELMVMQGVGIIHKGLSKHIAWEKFAYELFENNGWGLAFDDENVGELVVKGFEMRDSVRQKLLKHKNQFQLDWTYALVRDLISIQEARLNQEVRS